MLSYIQITAGEPAPWFTLPSAGSPAYAIDTAAGRYLLLCFFGSTSSPHCASRLKAVLARTDLFDDSFAAFFGVSADPRDQDGRLQNRLPGYRFLWDTDLTAAKLYGVAPRETGRSGAGLRSLWALMDPTMRMIATVPFEQDGSDIQRILGILENQPAPDRFAGMRLQAPILCLPRVFEPDLCEELIATYEAWGGELSGTMRQVGTRTVGINDLKFKSRRDCDITDQAVIGRIQTAISRRVLPEIRKAHQFIATRMERYIVSCYDAAEGGHFSPHRDNTTSGTAHRRFAISINLNSDFDGGEVSFPEYGPDGLKAPPGGAVVFSCSLLHRVSPVTRGRRYAFLPFVYDDEAAKLREANKTSIVPSQAQG
ncbi:2OG-Fe(II) oxygenase [Rhodobacter sp. 24-YEA-8]|uniref:2OG-Fe(II) oxygenase n=1 Tax=Rhodobacter sp. 24-YEA-8 TaxID=1884310 RepID=UPI00089BFC62|nr:2OG-Fe(II) oxygenase [Rhodobacter sp. 24-YEA-8]SEB39863.1 Predicted 2-oxoglutarate-and Fe(II)-dependent dioxygenase YbiX [Rhodobacter sp. 24-YEA-8]